MSNFADSSWQEVLSQVRAVLIRRGRSKPDAEDLAQEAWVRLATSSRDYEVREPVGLLLRIATNLSIDEYRSAQCRGEEVPVEDQCIADQAPSTEQLVLGRERMARMIQCLDRLNEKPRQILVAYRMDWMTYQAIAEQHGISISTVEKHVAKATTQLAAWMDGW